ncbi:CU044_5270 family protein [Nonomuraea sp. NPDC049695]|uniref:CU044_5270 family protein n=1 Tax=Nonomuraea sp. NPDC049695 TaxID=3154734 RepID=UPI00341240CB
MNGLKEFRRNTPAMTGDAAAAARARLMTAIREPEAARGPAASGAGRFGAGRFGAGRFGRRIAVAAALALVVGVAAVTLGDRPDMAPVAGVAELGERAAGAAENDPAPAPRPTQWLYTKELQMDGVEGDPDRDRNATWERWTSVDGRRSAWYQDGRLMFQDSAVMDPAELAEPPVTPAGVIARIEAAILDEDRRGPGELNGHVPPQILFMEINQLITDQWLAPEVRAALFRGLPAIKGITMTRDVPVADGRRGVAFSLIGPGARNSLVLDPRSFRYLGTNSTQLQTGDGKAGTVNLTAQLEARIVDQPGRRS